ncbi:MAG: branched-chain amino acid aminotransferase [Cytophagales bacterium]|jgi:branched-chain amino acid aminotransferase|nr:branched-chain amino acid aminotransferase [Cytophagales bacterium]MCA6388977.1 branched-chain amino acid aminotransferase [Cytophagales bacterium]MCA6390101.1 branched-chain amino acid aminotransferase [Cytophagales bacterium]MCA6394081.1 branched-chain amino acid aminotransferase [Cytophagales bacterium]MCA6398822.1 branched-chain amino acid aminotransferase [Cytophagales bacterium]
MAVLTEPIHVERVAKSRLSSIDFNNLGFGAHISDHMLMVDYKDGQWQEPKIVPFGNLELSPAMLALHYGQSVFEGMKAFKNDQGTITIFRPERHHKRLLKSLDRMCMPAIGEELFLQSLSALIEVDADWIPTTEGASLYLRPFVFASEAKLGVKVAEEYKFIILTSPVGPYFSKPIRVKVEEEFVRAAEGGTGFAKCAGNYGGAFYPTMLAQKQGFDQVLWTDAKDHKYIDESGAMNVMFVLNGKLVTPKLSTSLLDGVTRDSILTLASTLGVEKEERRVSVAEIEEAFKNKTITEAFGVGTAAVVSQIATIHIHGTDYNLPPIDASSFQLRVKKKLNDIRKGIETDVHNWNYLVK